MSMYIIRLLDISQAELKMQDVKNVLVHNLSVGFFFFISYEIYYGHGYKSLHVSPI